MADPAFGATLEGVRALLPHRTITPSGKPSEAQVLGFLVDGGARIYARVGAFELDELPRQAAATTLARSLAELYAAAMAEDAGFPEAAGPADTDYGALLWERFTEGLAELYAILGIDADEPAPAASSSSAPAHSFPEEPWFRRDLRW